MNASDRIKQRRKALGLSQEELAHRCGWKERFTVSKLENSGDRQLQLNTAIVLAKALHCEPSWLIGLTDEEDHVRNVKTDFSSSVGETIKKLREDIGMSQRDLANAVSISVDTLVSMENGENRLFSPSLMISFCEALNVPYSTFINFLDPVDNVGANIRALRNIVGFSEEYVASSIGMPQDLLFTMESSPNPSYEFLDHMSSFYNVPVGMLVGIDFANCSPRLSLVIKVACLSMKLSDDQLLSVLTIIESMVRR